MRYVLTITGASGSGKDTLMNALLCLSGYPKARPNTNFVNMLNGLQITTTHPLKPLVSHTTRDIRDGERKDRDYHFVTDDEFDKLKMLEEIEYAGHRYGLSEQEVLNLDDGDIGVVIVEPHGKEQIKNAFVGNKDVKVVSVFLGITEEVSKARMMTRNTSMVDVNRRIRQHRVFEEYTPHGLYDLVLTNNDTKDFCYNVVAVANFIKEINKYGA